MRFHPKGLERAFFSTRFSRKLDSLGYVTLQRFRLYGEESLAGKDAALRQLRLFDLAETLGEEGWLKVLRLNDYTARRPRQPETLQQVLFPYY